MSGQAALFPAPEAPEDDAGLVAGVEATLGALEGALTDRHRGLVELIRFEARRAVASRGIASVNFAKQVGEHLTQLLELPAGADASGNRVTQLSEYLKAQRLATDVRDTETA